MSRKQGLRGSVLSRYLQCRNGRAGVRRRAARAPHACLQRPSPSLLRSLLPAPGRAGVWTPPNLQGDRPRCHPHPLGGLRWPELLGLGAPVGLHVLLQNDGGQLRREEARGAQHEEDPLHMQEPHTRPGPSAAVSEPGTKSQVTYSLPRSFPFPLESFMTQLEK